MRFELYLKEFQGSPYRDMELVEMCHEAWSKLDDLKPHKVYELLA